MPNAIPIPPAAPAPISPLHGPALNGFTSIAQSTAQPSGYFNPNFAMQIGQSTPQTVAPAPVTTQPQVDAAVRRGVGLAQMVDPTGGVGAVEKVGATAGLNLLEKVRAPALLHILSDAGHTVQAIHPDDFETFKDLIDTGTSNRAQALLDQTGSSFHLSPANKAGQIIDQGALPLPGYAKPNAITSLLEQPRHAVTGQFMSY